MVNPVRRAKRSGSSNIEPSKYHVHGVPSISEPSERVHLHWRRNQDLHDEKPARTQQLPALWHHAVQEFYASASGVCQPALTGHSNRWQSMPDAAQQRWQREPALHCRVLAGLACGNCPKAIAYSKLWRVGTTRRMKGTWRPLDYKFAPNIAEINRRDPRPCAAPAVVLDLRNMLLISSLTSPSTSSVGLKHNEQRRGKRSFTPCLPDSSKVAPFGRHEIGHCRNQLWEQPTDSAKPPPSNRSFDGICYHNGWANQEIMCHSLVVGSLLAAGNAHPILRADATSAAVCPATLYHKRLPLLLPCVRTRSIGQNVRIECGTRDAARRAKGIHQQVRNLTAAARRRGTRDSPPHIEQM